MTQPQRPGTQLRRAVLSSYLGSVIEYYDFLLYATASAVVFNKVFFSNLDPLVGTVASFGTLATGYLARPLGGIVFGHFGDRTGRKKMLVLSMTADGHRQHPDRPPADLCPDRCVGADPAGPSPRRAGHRRGRRVGRCGADVGRARLVAARPVGQFHQRRRAVSGVVLSTLVLAASAAVTGEEAFLALGLADPVPAQHRAAGHRPVRPVARSRDSRLRRGRGRCEDHRHAAAADRAAPPPDATSCCRSALASEPSSRRARSRSS